MDTRFFEFDGIKSSNMGVHIVRPDGGRGEVPIWSSSSISSTQDKKRNYVNSYMVEREVLSFTFNIMLMDTKGIPKPWTPEEISRISKWLIHDTYKELRFGNNPDKLYYAIVVDAQPLYTTHEGGYMEITMETNARHGWSDIFIGEYDCTKEQINEIVINAPHNVNEYYYPEVEVMMYGDTELTITNISDRGHETNIKDLLESENFYMDCEIKQIKSGVPMRNLFANFNRNWVRLKYGENILRVNGKCKIIIKAQYPVF